MVKDRQNLDYLYDMAAEAGPEYLDIASRALSIDKDILSVESLGQDLNQIIWTSDWFTSTPEADFWRAFKLEFGRFICTKDPKYRAQWTKLGRAGGKSETVIVSTIAAAVAASAGLPAGALVPFCAVALIAVLKVGKEAFCKSIGELSR